VIDFRYHLVSIVAVFLALAIGIVLGSTTELRNGALTLLQQSSNALRSELTASQAKNAAYQAQSAAEEQFLQTAEPRLLAKLLDGESVVIVTEPGAQGSVVDGIKQAVTLAGATVTGEMALQPKFNDISGATQASLSSINNSIASTDGVALTAGSDPQTADQQQAAQLIATAILTNTTAQAGTATQGATAVNPQALLGAYAQAGYLTVSPSGAPSGPAQLAVLVTPQSAPADGAGDPANQVLLAVAQEFAGFTSTTLVAGGMTGSAQSGSAMSVLRSSSVSSQVSSVDDADTTLGQITVVQALAAQLAGGKPNSYGVSGASAVSPVPMPSATGTATATQTAQPNPTTTRKAGTKK
jgi:Copper transport outer membrane protein, MctB